MWKSSIKYAFFAIICAALPSTANASGLYSPPLWLENGGVAVEHSPEFFWEREIKKIAVAFKPTQRRVAPQAKAGTNANTPAEVETTNEQAARVDLADFQEAIDKGVVKGANALAQHKAAREVIAAANEATTDTLPVEPASEFADYNTGAFAFHHGAKHYDDAARHWEALLKRPVEERHYRSVWAAFMLGKLAVYAQRPEAVKWMRIVRQLAKDGFADSLGLAADSYGWEAKSELDQDHLEKAAQLYLTQLALGDNSAIVSLKALIPDRASIEGTMNFGPLPPENADEATLKKFAAEHEATLDARLARSARDPLLRRLMNAHVLATETVGEYWRYPEEARDPTGGRCGRWLSAVEKAGADNIEDADQLGWVAYTAGKYADAERWLKLSSGESEAALWLRAKLLRRAGKTEEAAKAMAAAWKRLRSDKPNAEETADEGQFVLWNPALSPLQSASGDLGALYITRGDFVNAYDVLESGGMHEDAAFVAERVLTADELKQYVDTHYLADAKEEPQPEWSRVAIKPSARAVRWMLGRRLVREDRYDEARAYLPEEQRLNLDKYVAALKAGENEKLSKAKRARAWFDAATIARYSGMELMGYEGAPDGFVSEGSFEATDVAGQRETGSVMETKYEGDKEVTAPKPLRLAVPVTAEEKKRLAANKPAPNKRFHYRYIAAALGWKAAALLPDQSDELADVLNSSGNWIKKDDKAADKYIQAIERRAFKTALGKQVTKKHWFVDSYGPWSAEPKP